jgi:RHS repeat-associated protein
LRAEIPFQWETRQLINLKFWRTSMIRTRQTRPGAEHFADKVVRSLTARLRIKILTAGQLRVGFLLAAWIVCFSLTCLAQSVPGTENIGLPAGASYDGDQFESVQLNNGNLHIEIPFWFSGGRGLPTGLKLVFDSKGWNYKRECTKISCISFLSGMEGGWRLVGSMGYSLGYTTETVTCNEISYPIHRDWVVREPDGTAHHAPGAVGPRSTCTPTSQTLYADDGSGWMINASGVGQSTAVRQDGLIAVGIQPTSGVMEDTNGNQLTVVNYSAPYTITDTLGRSINQDGSYQDANGALQQIQVTYQQVPMDANFIAKLCGCQPVKPGTKNVPRTITFPNGATYTIDYGQNTDGNPASITLPDGGQISWTYQDGDVRGKVVATRTVTVNGQSSTWHYTPGKTTPFGNPNWISKVTDPNGNDIAIACSPLAISCNISQKQYFSGSSSGGTLLKTEATDYLAIGPANGILNLIPIRQTVIWNQTNQVTKTETDWETKTAQEGNLQFGAAFHAPEETREYDYGTGAPGPLLRRTHYTYLREVNPAYDSLNISDRPVSVVVYDGNGNVVSETSFEYDNYNHPGMPPMGASGAVQHDPNRSTAYSTRGNVTGIFRWRNTDGAWIQTLKQYDDAGNVIAVQDANGNVTQFDYTDNWATAVGGNACASSAGPAKAFVTKTTNALNQSTTASYLSCTGQVASTTDANLQTTNFAFDLMNRPVTTSYPDGGLTTACYTDVGGATCAQTPPPYQIVTAKMITSSLVEKSTTLFDGMHRVAQTQLNSDPDGATYIDTTYDALGRVQSVSNPHHQPASSGDGITQHQYDALGRVTATIQADNSIASTDHSQFPAVTVIDEAGNQRRSRTDALGRLVEVDEPYSLYVPPAPGTGSISIMGTNTTGDTGSIYIAVIGGNNVYYSPTFNYNQYSDGHNLAYAFANTFNSDPASPVTAAPIDPNSSDNTLYLTSKATGAAANYTISPGIISDSGNPPFGFSPWGLNLSGGTDGATYPPSLSTPAVTLYSYDGLSNLIHVEQHGMDADPANWRQRNFQYDSLSRLISASNPESETIGYSYDGNGNVVSKTAPAPNQYDPNVTVTTYLSYDSLNRLTTRTFSDNSGSATYIYDQSSLWGVNVQNSVGRLVGTYAALPGFTTLTGASGGGGVGSLFSYDPMGRVIYDNQFNQHVLPWLNQVFQYSYNLDGSLHTLQYPSGHTLIYSYNTAQRPVSVVDNNGTSFASNAHYFASGEIGYVVNGATGSFSGIVASENYNVRLQPNEIAAAVGAQPFVLDLIYDYSSCNGNGANNGNVCRVVNNKVVDHSRDQSFTYDQLNRLIRAQSASNSGPNCWGESYGYDPWGNMINRSVTKCTGEGPLPGANNKNQMSGYGYDAAGNLTEWGFAYNSQNQLVSTPLANLLYDYDTDGRRVQKSNGTLYWYGPGDRVLEETDLSGKLKAEYVFFNGRRIARVNQETVISDCAPPMLGQPANCPPPQTVFVPHYYFGDHLGSTAVMTDAGGRIEEESDYYPFGWERPITDAGNGNHYKFTGKERDGETNLDQFGARYYAYGFARFITPDWAAKPVTVPYAKFGDPQSLNLYSYVENSPMNRVDADGHTAYVNNPCEKKPNCSGIKTTTDTNVRTDKNGNTIVTFKITISKVTTTTNADGSIQEHSTDLGEVSGIREFDKNGHKIDTPGDTIKGMGRAGSAAIDPYGTSVDAGADEAGNSLNEHQVATDNPWIDDPDGALDAYLQQQANRAIAKGVEALRDAKRKIRGGINAAERKLDRLEDKLDQLQDGLDNMP